MDVRLISFNKALDFIRLANLEDVHENYEEALNFYRLADHHLNQSIINDILSDGAKDVVRNLAKQYSKRALEVENYLNGTTHTIGCVIYSYAGLPKLKKAIEVVTDAVDADTKQNYYLALQYYDEAIGLFKKAIDTEANTDRSKEAVRKKLAIYEDRATKIRSYLNEKMKPKKKRRFFFCCC